MEPAAAGDAELVCKTLQVEHKLFYLDLKENPRGRYLKISEKTSGSRSTIIVPIAGVVWFVDLFTYYANNDEGELSSKELQLDTKVFYFDVGENNRGRFLKVSEASMTRNRSTIIVPAGATGEEGWAAFRNVLVEIHEASQLLPASSSSSAALVPSGPSVGQVDQLSALTEAVGGVYLGGNSNSQTGSVVVPPVDSGSALPPPISDGQGLTAARVVRAEQKRFFFDLGSNARGQYLKISEVTGADRSVIILPASALEQFHDTLGQFLEMVKSQGLATSGIANVRTIAPVRKRPES